MKRKQIRRILALFLTFVLTMGLTGGALAEELPEVPPMASEEAVEEGQEVPETGDTQPEAAAGEGETASAALDSSEICAQIASQLNEEANHLESLTPGEDYAENQGMFRAETEEEAKKVAEEYGATLVSYNHHVAVVDFGRGTAEALRETASLASTRTLVTPNYISHFSDARIEIGPEILDAAGRNTTIAETNSTLENIEATAGSSYSDPYLNYQWFHDTIRDGDAYAEGITGEKVTVAVLDTGISLTHDDLKANIKDSTCVVDGYSSAEDTQGHGSHCSGIVAAVGNNGYGGIGVAPDAGLVAVRIAIGSSIYDSDILAGIETATELGVDVISMSFGGYSSNSYIEEALTKAMDAGIVCVAAAGNEKRDSSSHYPSAYDGVICVGATTYEDNLASYSNYGDDVDVLAPGGSSQNSGFPSDETEAHYNIFSTYYNNTYNAISGTSMACPVVAGVVALMLSANTQLRLDNTRAKVDKVQELIQNTMTTAGGIDSRCSNAGLVQAGDAAAAAEALKWEGGSSSSSYTLVDQGGFYGRSLKGYICKGKSIKLALGDASGNAKSSEMKKLIKSSVWTSNSTFLTVKNGKVTCSKTATAGSSGKITVTVGTQTLSYTFTIIEPVFKFAYLSTKYKYKKGRAVSATPVLESSKKAKTSQYSTVNLTSPYGLLNGRVGLVYTGNKKQGYTAYSASTQFRYKIMIPKGQLKNVLVNSYQANGDPASVTFMVPGSYSVKYKALDGSNQCFTMKVRVYDNEDEIPI
ncbi:MAG: S8 family peptidase [Lachnospiraceae bacterium]|nr:S8 family peptidase [Lachnospiraceae bacterium]